MVSSLEGVVRASEYVIRVLLNRAAVGNEVALLLGTVVNESYIGNGRFMRVQVGGGPARGIVQMEVNTAIDIFSNYLKYKRALYCAVMSIARGVQVLPTDNLPFVVSTPFVVPTPEDIDKYLRTNDNFALAMARVHYLRVPAAIPTTLLGIAQYYKKYYNTDMGKATVDGFIKKYNTYKCNSVLVRCGYKEVV